MRQAIFASLRRGDTAPPRRRRRRPRGVCGQVAVDLPAGTVLERRGEPSACDSLLGRRDPLNREGSWPRSGGLTAVDANSGSSDL